MAETRPKKITLKVFGSEEVLQEPALMDYYRLRQVDDIYMFKLLGDFTSEGKYVISEDVKKTLIKVKKLISEVSNNGYVGLSELKNITLNFKTKYWQGEDGQGVANLYLIERLDSEGITSFIAQYVSEYSDDFKEKVKKAFNLFNEIDEFEDEYSQKIEEFIQIQQAKKAERDYVVEIQSEIYIKEVMRMLQEGGEQSHKLLDEFSKIYEVKIKQPNKAGVFTSLRKDLDTLIIKFGGFNAFVNENPAFLKVSQSFTKPVKRFDIISQKLDAAQAPKPISKPSISSKGGKSAGSKSSFVIPKAKGKAPDYKPAVKRPGKEGKKNKGPLKIGLPKSKEPAALKEPEKKAQPAVVRPAAVRPTVTQPTAPQQNVQKDMLLVQELLVEWEQIQRQEQNMKKANIADALAAHTNFTNANEALREEEAIRIESNTRSFEVERSM